jgi:hypothetical protein
MTAPSHSPGPRWTREQIRAARLAPLLPLLQRRRLQLRQRDAGNYEATDYLGLLLKDGYWRWPGRGLAGNCSPRPTWFTTFYVAIDFCMKLLGLSFHNSMHEITRP